MMQKSGTEIWQRKKTMARSHYGVEKWARVTALMILDAKEMLQLCPRGTRYHWKRTQA